MSVDITPDLDITYIAFNHDDPLFKGNVKLRQAMNLAYDGATEDVVDREAATNASDTVNLVSVFFDAAILEVGVTVSSTSSFVLVSSAVISEAELII